jgi:RNA polymerase sigma factor (sigma-70 family)
VRSDSDSAPPREDPEARELVDRCLRGEEDAWRQFLERYRRLIYATILKVGLPAVDQEEAFQETVVAIYQQLGRLRDNDRLVSWIVGIAWRQSINRIRARGRDRRVGAMDGESSAGPELAAAEVPPDTIRLALERAQHAQEALAVLSERCRRLVHYLFYEDPPPDYAEIARREEIPIGSLGPTRARCLEKLRAYFKGRGWL